MLLLELQNMDDELCFVWKSKQSRIDVENINDRCELLLFIPKSYTLSPC